MVVAWFAGSRESDPDVAIYGSSYVQGQWRPPAPWSKVNDLAHWNPVLFQPPGGPLTLFFKVGADCAEWQTYVCHSVDGGTSWGEAYELVPGDVGGRGPTKNKPIVLANGSILAPASLERGGRWRAFIDRSIDGGTTWVASPEIPADKAEVPGRGEIQPTLWESAPGYVHLLARSSSSFICRSDSSDGGRQWSAFRKTALPNNNSGIDLARQADGRLMLAYNPVAGDWGARTPLSLATSTDNGLNWHHLLDLETGPGEYSYPAVIATPAGFAGTYTWKRESIVFWEGRFG